LVSNRGGFHGKKVEQSKERLEVCVHVCELGTDAGRFAFAFRVQGDCCVIRLSAARADSAVVWLRTNTENLANAVVLHAVYPGLKMMRPIIVRNLVIFCLNMAEWIVSSLPRHRPFDALLKEAIKLGRQLEREYR